MDCWLKVSDLGFRVPDLRLMDLDLWCRVSDLGLGVLDLGFRAVGFGFRALDLGFCFQPPELQKPQVLEQKASEDDLREP